MTAARARQMIRMATTAGFWWTLPASTRRKLARALYVFGATRHD